MNTLRFLFFIFLWLTFGTNVLAHGDLHERIVATSEEIKQHPDSAYLYFKRGKLNFQHEDFKQSIKDLKKSKALHFVSAEQQLLLAKNYFELKKYNKSLRLANTILTANAQDVKTLQQKGKILYQQKKYIQAADVYENVIAHSKTTYPQNYIDASLAWENAYDRDGQNRAFAVVEQGIQDIGELTSLYEHLVDLAVRFEEFEKAITYQSKIVSLSPRKETAYYKLSLLYSAAGEAEKALNHKLLALEHFNKLPERIKRTPAMIELLEQLMTEQYYTYGSKKIKEHD